MGLKDVLTKLKLVEDASASAASSSSSSSKTPSLEEFLASVPPVAPIDESKLPKKKGAPAPPPPPASQRGEGLPVPPPPVASGEIEGGLPEIPGFPDIYRAAGIVDPTHGFTAAKVLEILSSPEFASLPQASKAGALLGFLKMNPAGPVPIGEIIQDAVRRDQALDRFEEFLRGKLAERSSAADRENARLQAEIDELVRRHREVIAANQRALDGDRQRFDEWLGGKRAEERRLAEAVAPFVDGNPISVA
jgi:hypothetical protein